MNFYRFVAVLSMLVVAAYLPAFAQGGGGQHGGGHHGGGHCHPDSLEPITVSGIAIVDTSFLHPKYFLDENNDGQADYFLNFGPWWYEPDSSGATRPLHGDFITISGGLQDSTGGNLPMIVVYEINGLFWRDPNAPFWTHHHHHHHHHGHAHGWMHDSLEVVSVSGIAIVDTTFVFEHYFLDENGDEVPDYFLNFGPPWYQPPSGATRPADGDSIDIVGGLFQPDSLLPMIVVYEINGLVWRDTTGCGNHLGGGRWIHRFMNQAQQIPTAFDPQDWLRINPGWHMGGGPHHGMPQRLFCQMVEIFPQNAPNSANQNAFAAYEIGLFDEAGMNFLWQQGPPGGHIQFANAVQYQLHYNDIQLQGFNINENSIAVKYWNAQINSWVELNNVTVNPQTNTVTFSTNKVSTYFILTGQDNPLGVGTPATLPAGFSLKQNYPNPFNPETTIEFTLSENARVVLSVYNLLGQKLFEILNEPRTAGTHQVTFDGSLLTSGVYFYELKVGNQSQVKKMLLNK